MRPNLISARAVARTMVNKAACLAKLGHVKEMSAAYDAVVAEFGDACELALREQVAMAMVSKSAHLAKAGRAEDALETLQEAIRRYGEAAEAPLKDIIGRARIGHGALLERTGKGNADANKKAALAATADEYPPNLQVYLSYALSRFPKDTVDKYFQRIRQSKEDTNEFFIGESRFSPARLFLMVLREWNS